MSELKEILRDMALERTVPAVQFVPVLNDPTKQIALPITYRDQILGTYGIELHQLSGESPIHAVFVREGLAITIVHQHQGRERVVVHGIDLRPGEDRNIEDAGAEVIEMWKALPPDKLLSYALLQQRWKSLLLKASQAQ